MLKFNNLYKQIIKECSEEFNNKQINEGFFKGVKHIVKSITGNPTEKIRLFKQFCQEYGFIKQSDDLIRIKKQGQHTIKLKINSDDGKLFISVIDNKNKSLITDQEVKIANSFKNTDLKDCINIILGELNLKLNFDKSDPIK